MSYPSSRNGLVGGGWSLTGNTGLTGDNFIGTADVTDINMKSGSCLKFNAGTDIIFNTGTTPAQRLKIDGSSGCVTIGDHTFELATGDIEKTMQLSVKGAIVAQEVLVDINDGKWSDFVFNKGYKLLPLNELESSINTNHKLPDIPSAEEVRKKGINIANMDAKLLQKIEELTLYVIDLQKQCDELKKKNKIIEQQLESSKK